MSANESSLRVYFIWKFNTKVFFIQKVYKNIGKIIPLFLYGEVQGDGDKLKILEKNPQVRLIIMRERPKTTPTHFKKS